MVAMAIKANIKMYTTTKIPIWKATNLDTHRTQSLECERI